MRLALILSWVLFALTWAVPLRADWNIYGATDSWVKQDRHYDRPYVPAKDPCK